MASLITHQDDLQAELATVPRLTVICSKALTTAPLKTAELENLPPHMLVQLLEQMVTERDQAATQVGVVVVCPLHASNNQHVKQGSMPCSV
jgi:hypothetical protein